MHIIVLQVCAKHKVSLTELRSRRRSRYLARARHEFWSRCKNETAASFPEMAAYLGCDHTSAMHGVKQHEKRMKEANGSHPVRETA